MDKNYSSQSAQIEKYSATVYRLALSYTKNKSDAEDIMQNVFLRYLKKARTFDSDEHEKAWFIRVTVNCCKSFFSSLKSTVNLDECAELSDTEKSSDEKLSVLSAVMSLPQKERVCVHLFYYEDMTVKEIAKETGMLESTVKSHLFRARNALREILKGDFANE